MLVDDIVRTREAVVEGEHSRWLEDGTVYQCVYPLLLLAVHPSHPKARASHATSKCSSGGATPPRLRVINPALS